MSGLPATLISGFGVVSVSGRMRVPSPAASTMAVRGVDAMRSGPQRRHMRAVPALQRLQRRMRQRAAEIGPYARHVTQILRLAVALFQAREDAEDLRGALRRYRGVELREVSGVEGGIGGAARARVAGEQRDLHRLRHVDARVL